MAIMGRGSLFGLAAAAAAGLPFLLHKAAKETSSLPDLLPNWEGKSTTATATPPPSTLRQATNASPLPIEGLPVNSLNEVFRFDVAPNWVIERWPRVTTTTTEEGYLAYRVPLVTGTREQDLAGGCTYCFDNKQKLQLIRFQGTTGDVRPIIQLVTRQYNLREQYDGRPGEQLFEISYDGKVISYLRIKPAEVIQSDWPTTRFWLDLSLRNFRERPWFPQSKTAIESPRWP